MKYKLNRKKIGYIGGIIVAVAGAMVGLIATSGCHVYTDEELQNAIVDDSCSNIILHEGTFGGFTLKNHNVNITGMEGARINGQIRLDDVEGVIIEGLEIYVSNRAGVFVQESDNVTIKNNIITTPTYLAQQTDGIYSQRNIGNIYENNSIIIYNAHPDGHDDGIQSYQDTDLTIRGNFVAQVNDKVSNAQGIYVTAPRGGITRIYNNIVDLGNAQSNALTFRLFPEIGGVGTVEMIGNTVYGLRPYHGLWVTETDNPIVKNNISYLISGESVSISGSKSGVSNNYTGNPQFVDAANWNFHLKLSSPAIDAGAILSSPYNMDKDGKNRGTTWDIGAYEYGTVFQSTNTTVFQQGNAFPGALGFGTSTTHGRGGTIIEVTNLNDSGTGSLRDAVSKSGARIIVFNVSGTIQLTSHIKIDNPYIYIAGQSSPNGIQLKGAGIKVRTHDVLIRGLMIRLGNDSVGAPLEDRTGIIVHNDRNSEEPYNVVIDNNSIQWGTDETASTYLPIHDVTFSHNIFAEGLHCAGHPDGCHSMGLQIASGANKVTVYANIIANNDWRNPLVGNDSSVEVINNYLYGWGAGSIILQGAGNAKMNVIGNIYQPAKCSDPKGVLVDAASPGDKLYTDNWAEVSASSSEISMIKSDTPAFTGSGIVSMYSSDEVLALAGARDDAVDVRIKNNITNNLLPNGRCFIDNESEVGGWVNIPSGGYVDSDKDGIPNLWEESNGLNPNNATDGKTINQFGYSNVEVYLNSLIFDDAVVVATSTPTLTPTLVTPSSTLASNTPTLTKTITPSKTVTSTPSLIPTVTPTSTVACQDSVVAFNHSVRIRGTKTIRLRSIPDTSGYIIGHLFDTRDQLSPDGVPLYIKDVVKKCNGDVWAIYGGYFVLRYGGYTGYTDVNPSWLP